MINKPNSSAIAFMVAGATWFAVGTLYGLLSAIHFVSPEAISNIAPLVVSRVRPGHVNTVIFGFVSQSLVGAALYFVPALLRTRLWSEKLGWLAFLFWTITVVGGDIGFLSGITQGREYTEYPWILDVSLVISFLLIIVNLVMTIANRQENSLYVSVWYVMGTMLWMTGVYPIGNVMWNPPSGSLPGLIDSIYVWFYAHNLVGLLLTPMAIGAAYFIIPRITRTPLYSHTLSLVGFWALVTLYSHIGGHHILQAPIPNWLKVVSVVDSVMMFLPVSVVLANMWLTARGRFGMLWNDIGGRWVLTGTLWYLLVCFQGPFMSLPTVQQVTHFTNWTVGHAHIAVLGFSGFIAMGAVYHVLPLACGRQLYSRKLASLQFGLVLFGLMGFFVVLTIAGLVQGSAWFAGVADYKVLPMMPPYMFARLLLGFFIIAGAFMGLYNIIMTVLRGQKLHEGFERVVPL